jgi:hypothetical protein
VRVALIVLCAAALLVAGCGSEDHPKAPADTMVRASEATKKLGGHHVEMDVRIETRSLLRRRQVEFSASGDVDPARNRASFEVDLSALVGQDPAFGTDRAAARVTGIKIGPVVYTKMGFLAETFREAGIDATWIKDDTSRAQTPATRALREKLGNSAEDPGQLLDYLDASRGAVERLGKETVRGASTTHYRGRVHLDRLGAGQPPAHRRALRANAVGVRKFTGRKTLPVEAWVDGRGAVRRIELDYELVRNPENDKPMRGSMRVVADISGFGREVRAEAPPEKEVISLEELVRLAE